MKGLHDKKTSRVLQIIQWNSFCSVSVIPNYQNHLGFDCPATIEFILKMFYLIYLVICYPEIKSVLKKNQANHRLEGIHFMIVDDSASIALNFSRVIV